MFIAREKTTVTSYLNQVKCTNRVIKFWYTNQMLIIFTELML